MLQSYGQPYGPSSPESTSFDDDTPVELEAEPITETPAPIIQGEIFQVLPFYTLFTLTHTTHSIKFKQFIIKLT